MIESQKTENVDLNKFLSDLNACFHIIQELVSLEVNSTRMVCFYKTCCSILLHCKQHYKNLNSMTLGSKISNYNPIHCF